MFSLRSFLLPVADLNISRVRRLRPRASYLSKIKFERNTSNVCPNSKSHRNWKNLLEGLILQKRASLASAITLIESQNPKKKMEAQMLLSSVLERSQEGYSREGQKCLSFRIGLTGPPGAGKSTFIETLGKLLILQGNRVAVLTVDPSSVTTGGSLLGDKTRMTELSREPNAYVRSSPTSGFLGGVTRTTNEAIALCECAGYNIIIVETVGVGQSEIDVAHMVDMLILLIPPAGGDELQALKKGIVEMVDLVAINKADGDLLNSARRIQAEYVSALKFVKQHNPLWKRKVLRISSKTNEGIDAMWETMCDFRKSMLTSGLLEAKRKEQLLTWMWMHIQNQLLTIFKSDLKIGSLIQEYESNVKEGLLTPGHAADNLINKFKESIS